MTIEVLISTIGDGIYDIPDILLSPRDDVRYLVSWQVDDALMYRQFMLMSCFSRHDVRLFTMNGHGLSRSRNNCLMRAEGDILLFSDDDCHYTGPYFDNLKQAFSDTAFDILLMQSSLGKPYPAAVMPLSKAMRRKGYYPSSVEMAVRRQSVGGLRFNEDFGLGSGRYVCGEEDVFLKDAAKAGLKVGFAPVRIVDTSPQTTGVRFLADTEVQRAKGATFRYVYPHWEAELRIMKEALHHWLYNGANPMKLYKNMSSQ